MVADISFLVHFIDSDSNEQQGKAHNAVHGVIFRQQYTLLIDAVLPGDSSYRFFILSYD